MSRERSTGRTRRSVAAAVTLVVVLVAGCTATGQDPAPSSSTAGVTEEVDVRSRLTDALSAARPELADVVADTTTTLTPVPTPWLPGHEVLDVLADDSAHPVRFYVALPGSGDAVVLTRAPEAFVDLVASAGVRVDDEATAAAVVDTYLDTTRSFRVWSERVSSLDEVALLPSPGAEQQSAWDAVRAQLDDEVGPTSAQARGDGFDVVAWVVDGDTLVRHDVRLTTDGGLTDRVSLLASGLPVPVSR